MSVLPHEDEGRRQYVYLGNLTPVMQTKFLGYYQEAEKHGVTVGQFVEAWNRYALSIEEHVFMTDTPGTAQVHQLARQ